MEHFTIITEKDRVSAILLAWNKTQHFFVYMYVSIVSYKKIVGQNSNLFLYLIIICEKQDSNLDVG